MKFNAVLDDIVSYEAGKPIELVVRDFGIASEDVVKLASNENPYGCSPKVQKAVTDIVANMALYPDDSMMNLKAALAEKFAVAEDELIIGAGSDQVIEFAIHAKATKGSKILMNSITFAMYEIYTKQVGAEVVRTTSREHDLEAFYDLYKEFRPEIIFICTPNNPTGDAIDAEKLKAFLDKIDSDTLVVVDGAYMEYTAFKDASKSVTPKELVAAYDNVLYLGTFSKAYGLGGMRVGYGIARPEIIKAFYKLRPPFNITTLTLEAATVALQDEAFVQECIARNFEEMGRYNDFSAKHDLEAIESFTNFVTLVFDEKRSASKLAQELLERGMIVRDLKGYGLNAIRVTIGTPEQNDRFFTLAERLI